METTATATVAPIATPETETVALVAPRFTVATGAELAEGLTRKREYLLGRVAAGVEKKTALAEFEKALGEKRATLTAATSALLTSPDHAVERVKKTATGWNVRVIDLTAKRRASEEKAAENVRKLEARLAAARAKLATA